MRLVIKALALLMLASLAASGPHAYPMLPRRTTSVDPCSFIGTTAPAVATVGNTSVTAAAASPHTINMPATISAGDALVGIIRIPGPDPTTITWPAGWTELFEEDAPDGSDDIQSIAWREADGTEGATISIAFDGGVNQKSGALILRITGAVTLTNKAPNINTKATGASTTPDPTSLAPSCGSKDYLWLWVGGWEGEQTSPPTGDPTNYTGRQGSGSGTSGAVATNCRIAISTRALTAASEDPGSWTISASDDWTAFTVAVAPD